MTAWQIPWIISVAVFPSWTVVWPYSSFSRNYLFLVVSDFLMVWCIEYWWAKNLQSAIFELAQEDPIWFRVRRPYHSAMTAWRSPYFYLCGSFFVELLCELKLSQGITWLPFVGSFRSVDELGSVDRKYPNSTRFELELDEPMWFLFTRPRTPQRLQFGLSNFIGARHCFLSCPYTFFSISRSYLFLIASDFLMVWCIEFWCIEYWWAKNLQSAIFELAQEDPIWFRVRRPYHSAMTAWRSSYFYLCGSFFVELLCELILSQGIT